MDTTDEIPSIDITGLDPAEVLAALYNRAKAQGMGWMDFKPQDMTVEEARTIIAEKGECDPNASDHRKAHHLRFDYLQGRVIKCSISQNPMTTSLYDRDNGIGAAAAALAPLLAKRDRS